ncbi:MAG: peptidylprolyl isomerase [Bacteroidia bacterium]|nr:peptidylprolyl isomerase [Bacteroidia bacterium]
MKIILKNTPILFLLTIMMVCLKPLSLYAQPSPMIADKIVAIVGGHIILLSEVESQYQQVVQQGMPTDQNTRCTLLEDQLFQRLLLNQAEHDSLVVSDDQIDDEMTRRIRFFIQQIGSQEKLEEFYGKSLVEIKADFKELIKDQLLSQQMQQKITGDAKVSPAEVRQFFNEIPKDSLPYINSEVEVGQIVAMPKFNSEEKKIAKDKAEDLRQRVLNGENFGSLAVLYSQDPGTAANSGELGFFERGQMVPEFDSWAFRLKGNGISEVFETEYGFHFMQLIERRGEMVNVRHILITPQMSQETVSKSKNKLDSVYADLKAGKYTFEKAAEKFSDDENTKNNGGLLQNPSSGNSKFEEDQLNTIDPLLLSAINELEPGQFTKPIASKDERGRNSYKIYYLKSRTAPHVANMRDDYQRLQEAALSEKKQKLIREWIKKHSQDLYVKIDPDYKNCVFDNNWIKETN